MHDNNLQEVPDEVNGLRADLLPRVWRVHEAGVLDLLIDVLVLVEGEGAGEADVDDDAGGPHVQAAVVALHRKKGIGHATKKPKKYF